LAQHRPEFEGIDEFKGIATKLVDKFPQVFNGINPNEIRLVGVVNKEPTDKKPPYEIKPVPMPIRMDCPYSYYVIMSMADWVGMDLKHQQVLVFNMLCSVSPENDGRIIPFDLKDHAIVVRNFGVDYMCSDVPDIMEQSFNIQSKED
jgi:hypothetical protein